MDSFARSGTGKSKINMNFICKIVCISCNITRSVVYRCREPLNLQKLWVHSSTLYAEAIIRTYTNQPHMEDRGTVRKPSLPKGNGGIDE